MSLVTFEIGPRKGMEQANALAWKHRHVSFLLMKRFGRNPFAFDAYRRAWRMWCRAVDRVNETTEVSRQPHNGEQGS
jgi:hypothetical protein